MPLQLIRSLSTQYILFGATPNEQTYQSMVIWLRIRNRQVAHIQTIAVIEAGTEPWPDNETVTM